MLLMEQVSEEIDDETLAEADLLDAQPEDMPVSEQAVKEKAMPKPLYAPCSRAQGNPLYAAQPQNAQPELLTFADYFGMLVLSLVPIGGLIALLIWSFSSFTGANRRNYARALFVAKIALDFFIVCLMIALSVLPYYLYY